MKRGVIFAAGSFYGLRQDLGPEDLIIAADAGYRLCRELNIEPNLVIGDFDSMQVQEAHATLSGQEVLPCGTVVRFPVEKDDTDTMLAVRQALEAGCDELHIYGGTGGTRLDHTLANLQTLAFAAYRGARAFLYDQNFVYTVIVNSSIRIERGKEWGLLSVFSMTTESAGVHISGVQYPLEEATLTSGFPLGVSNHIIEPVALVSVRKGCLLVGWETEE